MNIIKKVQYRKTVHECFDLDVDSLQPIKFSTLVSLNLFGLSSLGVKFSSHLIKNVESDIKSNCVRESYRGTR